MICCCRMHVTKPSCQKNVPNPARGSQARLFFCCCLLLHIKFNLLIVSLFKLHRKTFFCEKCSVTHIYSIPYKKNIKMHNRGKRINFPYALKIKFYSGTIVWNRMRKYCYVRLQESLVSLVCNTSTKIKITIGYFIVVFNLRGHNWHSPKETAVLSFIELHSQYTITFKPQLFWLPNSKL